MPTVSIAKGKGHLAHNDRSLERVNERSWDANKSDQNIVYTNENIEQAYDRLFGKSLQKYNQSQIEKNHPERQIKDYYDHISRSKQEKLFYELIVAFGNIHDKDNPEVHQKLQECLDEYNRDFGKRNPSLFVLQQITHCDEKGMDHTHIDVIPVSKNNKRGLEVKNSMRGALKEMGYSGKSAFLEWRQNEEQVMAEILKKHGLELERGDGRDEHLNVREYQAMQKEVERQAELKLENMELPEMPKPEIKTNPITKTEVIKLKSGEFQQISTIIERQQTQIASLEARNRAVEAQLENNEVKLDKLRKKPSEALYGALAKDYENLKKENDDLKYINNSLYDVVEEKRQLEDDFKKLEQKYDKLKEEHKQTNARMHKLERWLVNVMAHLPDRALSWLKGIRPVEYQSLKSQIARRTVEIEHEESQSRKMKMR